MLGRDIGLSFNEFWVLSWLDTPFIGFVCLFSGYQQWRGWGVWGWPITATCCWCEECMELYFHLPSMPSWHMQGQVHFSSGFVKPSERWRWHKLVMAITFSVTVGPKCRHAEHAWLLSFLSSLQAEACKSVEYAMKKCPNGMYSEIKYDGERVQVHKKGSEFRYFSRSLKPVLPHKVRGWMVGDCYVHHAVNPVSPIYKQLWCIYF